MSSPLTVCYFGAYRPTYPRNQTIRKALAQAGIPVIECQVSPKWPTWRRWIALLRQYVGQPAARKAAVIFVAEFSHTVVPLAWLLSRWTGAALIFDPGISFYDEMVICQRACSPGSLRARYLYILDWLALHLADLVIWFTPIDHEYFIQYFGIAPKKSNWIAPGVDEGLFAYVPLPESDSPFIIHWDGSFIVSHGVEVIVEAAALLKEQPDIRFELVGDGPTAPAMKARATALELSNLIFTGSISREALGNSVRRAQVSLGVFRADDKLRRSLYTKELQAMLMGRPVITADGEAKRRLFVDGRDLCLIPPDSPERLAAAILDLRRDGAKREALAGAGHKAVLALCSVEAIEMRLAQILQQALQNRPSLLHRVGQDSAPPL